MRDFEFRIKESCDVFVSARVLDIAFQWLREQDFKV
jgi:hypothetical protein